MKVAVFSTKSYDKESFKKEDNQGHELVFFDSALNIKTIQLAEGFDAVCVFVNDDLNDEVLICLARIGVRLVILRCAGFNNVDIESATKKGISVLRVPAYSPTAVAEHALALIFTLNRKTHKAYNRVREGNFSIERLGGFELSKKTIGIIGTGKIGSTFAKMTLGLGCKVLAYDQKPQEYLKEMGVTYVSQEDLLRNADIISLHCPLTPATQHLINEDSLRIMKKGVMIINTSRGKLIDTRAIIKALKDEHLGYLGIDVYEQEENLFFKDLSELIIRDDKISRLMTFPNVLVTAHQAFFTDVALHEIAQTSLQNITDYQNSSINPRNVVTIDMIK